MSKYAEVLGANLRRVRLQHRLSLEGVERESGGRWTAMAVGSYERADRGVTVTKLAELADFYGIPVSELLPETLMRPRLEAPTAIVLDRQRLRELPAEQGGLLERFVSSIEQQRGDYNGKVITLRGEDLRSLATLYDRTPGELVGQLIAWGVLQPGADVAMQAQAMPS